MVAAITVIPATARSAYIRVHVMGQSSVRTSAHAADCRSVSPGLSPLDEATMKLDRIGAQSGVWAARLARPHRGFINVDYNCLTPA
jgi:hypothetical protein